MEGFETVRSYARVFQRQWRIYTIPDGKGGKIRLFRNGIAMRTVGYFVSCLFVMIVLSKLPVVGWVLGHLTWVARFVGLPAAGTALLTLLEPDGRSAALWLLSMVEHYLVPSVRSAGRSVRPAGSHWVIDDGLVMVAPTAEGPVLPEGAVIGPGSVAFREDMLLVPSRSGRPPIARPVGARMRRRTRERCELVGADQRVVLDPGDVLRVRP